MAKNKKAPQIPQAANQKRPSFFGVKNGGYY